MSKRVFFFLFLALASSLCLHAQEYVYTEASSLTLTGKLFPDTPNPYHRVDTVRYKGFTKSENRQVRESSGIAVAFCTNSPEIRVKTVFGEKETPVNTMGISAYGYDLYIRKDGQWLWAGAAAQNKQVAEVTLAASMNDEMKECLMYLPTLSEEYSVQIGIQEGSTIQALPNPFRHRIGIFGSSFTHGISTSRSGMDGFIFDSFSNPTEEQILERLFPFIEKLSSAHPGKPLIFQRTIYRENRNFNQAAANREESRIHLVDSLMSIACARYPDVYYVFPDATAPDHETSVDGIHPSDHGYGLWAHSIEKAVMAILFKYGIQ